MKSEPSKGKLYLVKATDNKGRLEGLILCEFLERKYRGCQLHGDRLGYEYVFSRMTENMSGNYRDKFSTVIVSVPFDEDEKDNQILIERISSRILEASDFEKAFTHFGESNDQ